MPEKGIRSTYSQCPFQIQMWHEDEMIATGTAFYYERGGEWFLITNGHNLTGRDFLTSQPIDPDPVPKFPTFIKACMSSYKIPNVVASKSVFTTVAQRVEIYENYAPRWFEHPDFGRKCDVVALPLPRSENCPEFMHNAANRISDKRVPVQPGVTVYIIGFPSSISVGFGLPLWKSGYIASEPYYNITIGGQPAEIGGMVGGEVLPAFFIDSQTRKGMSGAPVFANYTGGLWSLTDPYEKVDMDAPGFLERDDVVLNGTVTEFIGCYSGRVGGNERDAALGLCWGKEIIEKICAAKKSAAHPHIFNKNS